MEFLYALSIVLLGCLVMGSESLDGPGELKREKKDISKLQALFGWKQSPQIPVGNYHEWKRPLYYVPPCNCWRPTTRYGSPEESVLVYQPARPSVAIPAQPAVNVRAQPPLVIPAQPALASPPQPSYVIPAEPARYVPPPRPQVIPSSPALASPPQPSYVIPAEPARYVPPPRPQVIPSSPALATPSEPCIQQEISNGYHYDKPQTPFVP